jgi:colanic acid biosynthesis glycosyl transferase WcaI
MLTLVFAPDCVSTANLMTEIASDLQALGHEMVVVTTEPHSNLDPESRSRQPLTPRWGKWVRESEINGVHVYHTIMRGKGARILGRAWDYVLFHAISLVAALRLGGRWDIIFAPSPPLSIGVVAWLLGAIRKTPFVYNVQEIHPDALVDAGVLRNPAIVRLMRILERFVYARASKIVVISPLFKEALQQKGVPARKIEVVPNFVDVADIKPLGKKNPFSVEHSLDDKFVALYAGNIGLSQDMNTLMDTAEAMRNDSSIVFLVVGDGVEREQMEHGIKKRDLPNILMLPFQPRSTVPDIYATADICLVGLRKKMAYTHVPSKIYTILAAGKPALVGAEPDSEIAVILKETGGGLLVPPEDPAALAKAILELKNDPTLAAELGNSGRAFIVDNYSRSSVVRQHERILESAIDQAEAGKS